MTEVRVADDLWDARTIPEGVVANWFYQDGSIVDTGVMIAELMVEKTTYDIVAPVSGRLEILVPKDGVVKPGTVLARITGA